MDCVFCSIVKGEAPASVVYEDEKSLAFLALHPINEGHALVDEFGWTYREGYGERPALRADLDAVAERIRNRS